MLTPNLSCLLAEAKNSLEDAYDEIHKGHSDLSWQQLNNMERLSSAINLVELVQKSLNNP